MGAGGKVYVSGVTLAGRWGVSLQTVHRYLHVNGVRGRRFRPRGLILYRVAEVQPLEAKIR